MTHSILEGGSRSLTNFRIVVFKKEEVSRIALPELVGSCLTTHNFSLQRCRYLATLHHHVHPAQVYICPTYKTYHSGR
jgi:hypothetical protein